MTAILALSVSPAYAQDVVTVIHTVQPGETLSAIAARYDVTADEILARNDLDDPDAIIVGQQLLIPNQAGEPAPAGMHRVRLGETLTSIAARYDLAIGQLMGMNGIQNPDELTAGQLLIVSNSVTPTPPTTTPITQLTATSPAAPTATATPAPTSEPTAAPPTLAATSTATAAPTAAPLPETHTVAAGETLTGIARRYDLTVAVLMSLNDLIDPNAIRVGEVLQLTVADPPDLTVIEPESALPATPAPQQSAATGAAASPPATTPLPTPEITRSGNPIASLNRIYTVRPGDSLGLIALRLGLDLAALAHLNGFSDTAPALNAGRTLLLPAVGDDLRTALGAEAYVVKPGESLGQIAAAFNLTIGDLLAANRLADPNAIYPGERLLIPARTGQNGAGFVQIGLPRSGYFYYTVQAGDTISALANQFNTTMQAIREYNSLPNNDSVYAGREIRIPYGVPTLVRRFPPVPLSGTRFVVSISRQQCWAYHGERVAFSWDCSTGAGERRTKPGNYDVQSKILNAKSNIFRLDMPYWLGIYDVGPYENGIHGLPVTWDSGRKIWSGLIGQPATFGCAMLGDLDAATLFRMAFLGMPVHVVN